MFPDPVLRKKAKPAGEAAAHYRGILSEMAQLMYSSSGIGLAGPQVGLSESLIVADIGKGLYKLINPKIIKKEGAQSMEEGCLSIPGVCIKIKRAEKVVVSALDEYGKPLTVEAEGLLACVFQHEIDHLSGKLIIDRASFFEKIKIKKILEALKKKAGDEGLPKPETESCKLQM